MVTDLKKLVIEEFSMPNIQAEYIKKAEEGLWASEEHFINKYFKSKGRLLDIGCGTGRTTIPLYRAGFEVTGIDLVPVMISNAKKIAQNKKLPINYQVADVTQLEFKANIFDYAIFSNQGWTQIPGKANRSQALKEVFRVLKPSGVFIFTAHPRIWSGQFFFFWLNQWLRFYLLKKIVKNIPEQDFGDRFFVREADSVKKIYNNSQYIHIPAREVVKKQIKAAGFEILETNGSFQISKYDNRRYPPVFYICQKK